MFRRRHRLNAFNRLYAGPAPVLSNPLSIPHSPAATELLGWSQGLVIALPFFVIAGTIIRGWYDTGAVQLIAGVSLVGFLWAYLLARVADRAEWAGHATWMLWANVPVMLLLVSAMLGCTWGALSPLFWTYLVLILSQLLVHRRRGLLAAWGACIVYAALAVLQAMGKIPPRVTGVEWAVDGIL